MSNFSPLQKARLEYKPKLSSILDNGLKGLTFSEGEKSTAVADVDRLKLTFPKTFGQPVLNVTETSSVDFEPIKVGVVLSGGPAPGGHNVILGLFDGLKSLNPANQLLGFKKGPGGIVDGDVMEITEDLAIDYRNTGGFDIIMSGRTKIETPEQFSACLKNCESLNLKALLVIGGDDSNTNAAMLAEYFMEQGSQVQVVGAPKTIDGDLKNKQIEASFGFDTACKTYAELVGNICRDAVSSVKYWHFVRLMGRSASHISLEVGLQTQVNLTLVGEEVEAKQQKLSDVVSQMADVIAARAKVGKNYGVMIIPEGIIEFIPEVGSLISKLNDLLAEKEAEYSVIEENGEKINFVTGLLSGDNKSLFESLPEGIRLQLIADRDPHGNVQVSLIETEKLLSEMIATELKLRKGQGAFEGKFSALHHFFGYEGRCATPSNFDADYAYGLGTVACLLIAHGKRGYIACLRELDKPVEDWVPCGVPLTSMMNMERRHGSDKPVIRKALVELDGAPFKEYESNREDWSLRDAYRFPGPIQYFGPREVCDQPTLSLRLEKSGTH
jgi:pyrophosphate--fructose-6-phosphate 1-phosphotransferase